jgi:hypothetical protein
MHSIRSKRAPLPLHARATAFRGYGRLKYTLLFCKNCDISQAMTEETKDPSASRAASIRRTKERRRVERSD